MLPGGRRFLINCKIKNSSRVTLTLKDSYYLRDHEHAQVALHARFPKTHKMLRNLLNDLNMRNDYLFEIASTIPIGKGLSSSTADMVAAARALSRILGRTFEEPYLDKILAEIEPNDGLHYDGTSIYYHKTGALLQRYDYIPAFQILGIDFGGSVDTCDFNNKYASFPEWMIVEYERILADAMKAYSQSDSSQIAAVATRSFELWQNFAPKPCFKEVLKAMEKTRSIGVINTHSGTVVGLLFPPERIDKDAVLAAVSQVLPPFETTWFETVSVK